MAEMKAMICIATVLSLVGVATAADYIVGGPAGVWDMSTDYKSWAAAQKFAPGDSLTFNYNPFHNVLEVTKDSYEACTTANPTATYYSGTTTIVLVAPGKRYFICGAPGHCQGGMKLEVDVTDQAAAPTPPPRQAKRRSSPAPVPLPPSPMPLTPAPMPATPRHARHKKHKRRHSPPSCPTAPARAPVVESVEADLPFAALAPVSAPPAAVMASGGAADLRAKWGAVALGLALGGAMVLFL